MTFLHWSAIRRFVTALSLIAAGAAFAPAQAEELRVGTWKLVKRTLPDGKVLTPPAIQGYFSRTADGLYHLTVFFSTPDGKNAARNSIVQNKFGETELTATVFAGSFDDGSGKVVYDTPGTTKTVPIKRDGNKISYQHPFDPPFIVWDGDTLTATFDKGPVDTWERIK